MSAFGGKAPACAHSAICPPRSVYLCLSISVAKTNGRKSRTTSYARKCSTKASNAAVVDLRKRGKMNRRKSQRYLRYWHLADIPHRTADVRLLRRYAGRQRHRLISTILELDDHEDHLVVADIFQIVNCEFALA